MATRARLRRWIAFSPLIYLIHDLEELATARTFVETHWSRLPQPLLQLLGANTDLTHVYAIAITILLVAMAAVAVGAAAPNAGRAIHMLFGLCVMMRFANGLLHIALAIGMRTYVPGLVTAVLLLLPYSVWLMSRLERNWLVRHEAVHVLFILGLLLQLPVIALVILLARVIAA